MSTQLNKTSVALEPWRGRRSGRMPAGRNSARSAPDAGATGQSDCTAPGIPLCANEQAAVAVRSSMAMLLSAHILHDGELVLLILRPSPWFILLSSLRFIAAVLILAIGGKLWGPMLGDRVYIDLAAALIAARLMLATLAWMGRLYVLTDLRIVRLSGVLAVNVFDCPLRKIQLTRLQSPLRERVLGLGSIEIIPAEGRPTNWSIVSRPAEVHETIVAAINRAKQNGFGGRK